ncbi:O-antigen ligase family protein [Photobacterium ganghwense]|uniref:O-antigen ligase family protein n=1 Tax=Photobacterium ganghwense TaxID=320778 RepID=UPI0040575DEA
MKLRDFILLILLFSSQFDISEVTLILSLLIILLLVVRERKLYIVKECLLLLSIILISAAMSGLNSITSYQLSFYEFYRDFFYFIQAPIYLYLGYLLIRSRYVEYYSVTKIVIIAILSLSIFNIAKIPFQLSSLSYLGMSSRINFEFHNIFSLLVVVIVYNYNLNNFSIFNKKTDKIILVIAIISILLSFSRTSYVILSLILLVPTLYRFKMDRKVLYSLIIFIVFNIFGGHLLNVKTANIDDLTFTAKFSNSLSEVVVRELDDRRDISNNWRAYEAYMGLDKYLDGNSIELVFGQGFGAIVKTPYWIFNGELLDVIPIFHNGYITVLLKSGLLGLFLYITFILQASRVSYLSNKGELRAIFLCKVSISFMILTTSFVTHGIYNKNAPFLTLVFLGIIIAKIYNDMEFVGNNKFNY